MIKGMKKKTKIVLIVILSVVALAVVAVATALGLHSRWTREVIEDLRLPSQENSFTMTVTTDNVSDGRKINGESTLKYDESRRGLWLYMNSGSQFLFVYDDTGYYVYYESDSESQVYETTDLEHLKYKFEKRQLGLVDYIWEEISTKILSKREEVIKGVWKIGGEYRATLDGEYLLDRKFNGLDKKYKNTSIGKVSCAMTAPEGVLQSLNLKYTYSQEDLYKYGIRRVISKDNINLKIEQSVQFNDVVLPESFKLAQSQQNGKLLKSVTEYTDEYADVAYVTPDDAVTVYSYEKSDLWGDYIVAVYPDDGVLTMTRKYGVDLFGFPSMKKLATFEFYAEVARTDVAYGRLTVTVSGVPRSGSSDIDSVMPSVTKDYRFNLSDYASVGNRIKSSRAGISVPPYSSGTGSNGIRFVEYTPRDDGYIYKEPDGFSFPKYSGYSFKGYDLCTVYHPSAFGLYNVADGVFDYVVPDAASFGSGGRHFVCSLGDGKYTCFIGNTLFEIDTNKIQSHCYE